RVAWVSPSPSPVTGEPLLAPIDVSFMRGPKKIAEAFEAYRKEWTGKLRGRIVLLTPVRPLPSRETALFHRYTDAELADLAKAPDPAAPLRVTRVDDLEWPERPEDFGQLFNAMAESLLDALIDRFDALLLQRAKFFADEGVAAILMADDRAREGLLAAE